MKLLLVSAQTCLVQLWSCNLLPAGSRLLEEHGDPAAPHLEGGDVEILPEGQTQDVQVLTAVAERTGQRDED